MSNTLLQFLLLPIRDWNDYLGFNVSYILPLQFLLLPIRDWNGSLSEKMNQAAIIAISITPY